MKKFSFVSYALITVSGVVLFACSSPKEVERVVLFNDAAASDISARELSNLPVQQLDMDAQPAIVSASGVDRVAFGGFVESDIIQTSSIKEDSNLNKGLFIVPLIRQITKGNSSEVRNIQSILQSALNYYEKHSSSDALIEQRKAEKTATERQAWPDIIPTASVRKNQKAQAGLEARYTVYDFGLNNEEVKQRKSEITKATWQKQLDQSKRLADTLNKVANIVELRERLILTRETLNSIEQLWRLAQDRQASGVDSGSDEMLLSIKVAELRSEISTTEKQLELQLSLLNTQLDTPVKLSNLPVLQVLLDAVKNKALSARNTIYVQQARLMVEQAEIAVSAQKKSLYPKLVAHAGGYINYNGDTDTDFGLSLQAPTGIFSGSAQVDAKNAALFAAQREYSQLNTDVQTELTRLDLEQDRLTQNLTVLDQLISQTEASITLFNNRFDVSKVAISDGISPYTTLLRTEVERNKALVELVSIQAARLPFVLQPQAKTNDETQE